MPPARPELRGDFGMVSSTHWLGSSAGMSMLERGGNAFDAAAAAALALMVVEPHMSSLGGEVPIIVWPASEQRVRVICGQGPAPAGATLDAFAGLGLDMIPGTGYLPACVPGAFAAWTELLERYGTMELHEVVQPAVELAAGGFPVGDRLHEYISVMADHFVAHWPSSARTWLHRGRAPAAGTRLRLPALASTLAALGGAGAKRQSREQRICAARDLFYRGEIAARIENAVLGPPVMDSSGHRHSGFLVADDMARFVARVEDSVSLAYGGLEIHKASTWTQGLVMLQQLAILQVLDISSVPRDSGYFIHLVVEAAKLALADREAWYGDPEAFPVPVDALLAEGYAQDRASLIGEVASFELRPGSPCGRDPVLPPFVQRAANELAGTGEPAQARLGTGEPAQADERDGSQSHVRGLPPLGDTVHLDVIDRWGNAVSATPSGGWLQSSPEIPGLGFALGTRAQVFWLHEGLATTLRPRTRPRSTLTPTLALRDGHPWLAFGSPGGDGQDQWATTFLLTLLHHAADLQLAIDAPTFHTRHAPGSFYPRVREPGCVRVEAHTPGAAVDDLRRREHVVIVDEPWSQGWLCAVGRDRADGWLRGAANPRGRQGYVVGR